MTGRGINCNPDSLTNLDGSRSCRPESVQPAWRSFCIPAGYRLRYVRESIQTGTCSRWTNNSRTTLRVLANRPGLLHRDCPPQASPLRPVAAEGGVAPLTHSSEREAASEIH